MQARRGRRGNVFAIRLTPDERTELEGLMGERDGPRSLGPWLVWAARAGAEVLPGRQGSTRGRGITPPDVPVADRLILDLCGGSGAWSDPYRQAGYPVHAVTLPDDVRTWEPPAGAWGVLAAPPCDQFSLARNGHPTTPRDFVGALAVVHACLAVALVTRPRWWALENPVGLLSRWLGTPRDVWEPCHFGDPWTKRTALWGCFSLPRRGPFVEPLGGGPLCTECDPERRRTTWCSRKDHRARTPPGFARAFFAANP